jgi:hypothetical protein
MTFHQFITCATAMLVLSACQSIDRGSFGPFDRSLNSTSHGYSIIEDPTGQAPPKLVERFEVKPGDCGSDDGWSDCTNDRERSEMSQQKPRTPAGTTYWYGWSIYVPMDYQNIFPTKVALGQFHQDKSHPVWMFQNSVGGYHLDDQVFGSTRRYYPLINKDNFKGKWHRIEVNAKWAKNSDGFFKVWVNGVQKVDYKGQTMTANANFFKYGVYRSFMSRYENNNDGQDAPGQTVYFANVKRSKIREGLQPAQK